MNNMHKRIICALFALSLMVVAKMGIAQELKVGVVDVEQILAPRMEVINSQLREDLVEPGQEKIAAAQQNIQDKVAKLQAEAVTMSLSERQQLEDEIRALDRDVPRMQQDLQDDVNRQQQRLMEQFNVEVLNKINAFATAQDYDLIIQKNVALFSAASLDITNEILEALA